MASFSFGAGNVAKLLRIPLYGLGRLVTLVVPRTQRWVFGCGAGIGDGALALYNEAVADHPDAVWLVASERDRADAEARGIPTIAKGSWRGFWATARAGVIVVTHGLGDVNRYATSGAFIAQLWHGIPLKRIGLDSAETLRLPILSDTRIARAIMARLYHGTMSQISVIPAASHLVRGRLESAFGLPDDKVIVTGEPRVDPLSVGDAATRRTNALDLLRYAVGDVGERVVLYAPTWRDGKEDPAIPTDAEWRELVDTLEQHDAVLLIRSHPLGAGAYVPPFETSRIRLIGSDVVRDVTPIMPALDLLITDYSSMLFDVGLVPAGVLFLAPDATEYERTRGFYGRYDDVTDGDVATSWHEAIRELDAFYRDDTERERRTQKTRDLSRRFHDFRDGKNTQRVYREIQRRISGAQRGSR